MTIPTIICVRCGVHLSTFDEMFHHGRVCMQRAMDKAVDKAFAERGPAGTVSVEEFWDVVQRVAPEVMREEFDEAIERYFDLKKAGLLPGDDDYIH